MADNAFIVSNLVAQKTAEFFEFQSPILNTANREYVETFGQGSYATGGAINIKIPGYPAVQMGLSVTPEAITDQVIPFVITSDNDLYSVPYQISLYEQKFNILGNEGALTKAVKKAIIDNYAWPAFLSLEGEIETTAALRMNYAAFMTPIDSIDKLGSINTYSAIANIGAMMDTLQFTPADRVMMMNVSDATAVATSLQNMFNPVINEKITMTARIGGSDKGRLADFDMFRSPQIYKHVSGPLAAISGYTIASVSSDGTQITITGVPSTTSQLVNAGDMISIPSVYVLNPITKVATQYRLVVTAGLPANGNGSGQVTVTLSTPLLASGMHANVSALPGVGAAVMVYPNYNPNYAYTPSGLSAVPLPLDDIHGATNSESKASNRCPVKTVIQGAVSEFTNIFRTSILCGILAVPQYLIAAPSLA